MGKASAGVPDRAVSAAGRNDRETYSYRRLKPRPGHSGASVTEHQIARIHAATIDLVAEGGFESLTVTGVARAAGVSKRTFYEHFAGKEECFLATYDLIVREMTRGILAAECTRPDWPGRLRKGFAAFAREVARSPRAAHLALVDVYVDLPGARERRRHTAGLLEALIGRTFSLALDGAVLPPELCRAIVGAGAALARGRLLAAATEEFCRESEELAQWALSLRDPAARKAFLTPVPARPRLKPTDPVHAPPIEGPRSEREAIVSVAAQITAAEGYRAPTVERVRRELGLSRARVEPDFPSREECLLVALESRGGQVIGEVRAAFSRQDDWPGGVAAGVTALCARLDADPVLARLVLVETFEAGVAATEWRASKLGGLASLLRATAPAGQGPTRLQAEASLAGAWAIVASAAQHERPRNLLSLAPGLAYIILAPVVGSSAALEAIQRPRATERSRTSTPVGLAHSAGSPPAAAGRREKEPVPGC